MSIVHVTVSATLDLPRPTLLRAQLLPLENPTQRVVTTTTSAGSAVGVTEVHLTEGARVTYLELPAGPAQVDAAASVRLGKPAHAARRIPALTWDQCAALIRAVRSTGRTGDGTPVTPGEALFMASTSVPSALVPIDDDARDLAFSTLAPGQPLIVGIAEVASKVAARGLDAAAATHTMIGAMRAVGIAASYTVGVVPEHGIRPWASICIPGFAWFPIDPVRARPVDPGAVVLATGRDASDTPLIRCPDGTDCGAQITATVVPRQDG